MTVDRSDLLAYLRQLADVGERSLLLEHLTADDVRALLRTRPAVQPAPAVRVQAPSITTDPVPSPRADASVRSAASKQLQVLQMEASGCTRCRLHAGRRTVVFGEGNPNADVMVVGEAPGQEEDRTGRPFVGQGGKLLDLLLMTAGFPRESVYICNTLKCRPPQNRNPLPDEMEHCSSFLHGQIDAVAPRALIAVGKFAAQALLNSEESIGRLRGQVHSYRGIPLIVTYHPAYILRSPQQGRVAWQDFQLLRQVLDEQA